MHKLFIVIIYGDILQRLLENVQQMLVKHLVWRNKFVMTNAFKVGKYHVLHVTWLASLSSDMNRTGVSTDKTVVWFFFHCNGKPRFHLFHFQCSLLELNVNAFFL